MHIDIIGNDGITLCREAPASVIDGEIAVASKERLRAAPLSSKRVLLDPVRHLQRRGRRTTQAKT